MSESVPKLFTSVRLGVLCALHAPCSQHHDTGTSAPGSLSSRSKSPAMMFVCLIIALFYAWY